MGNFRLFRNLDFTKKHHCTSIPMAFCLDIWVSHPCTRTFPFTHFSPVCCCSCFGLGAQASCRCRTSSLPMSQHGSGADCDLFDTTGTSTIGTFPSFFFKELQTTTTTAISIMRSVSKPYVLHKLHVTAVIYIANFQNYFMENSCNAAFSNSQK